MKILFVHGAMLFCLLLTASAVFAGAYEPKEIPAEPVVREKVTATPAETAAAVTKARQAVAPAVKETPVVKEVPMRKLQPQAVVTTPQAKPVATTGKNDWMLAAREGGCEPLSAVKNKVKNIGSFKTPQEFSRQMKQRGYQSFALDIGDERDQVVRVKVPDLDFDMTFTRAGLCH